LETLTLATPWKSLLFWQTLKLLHRATPRSKSRLSAERYSAIWSYAFPKNRTCANLPTKIAGDRLLAGNGVRTGPAWQRNRSCGGASNVLKPERKMVRKTKEAEVGGLMG
jgi:hypothetical protein